MNETNSNIKSYVGMALIIALVALSVAALWYVSVYNRISEPGSFRSFSVSAEGKAIIVPDVAEFTFEVISEGGVNLADTQAKNTEKTNNAIAFVKSKGVDAKDIKTQGYNVEPRYQYYDCGAPAVPIYFKGESGGVSGSSGVSAPSAKRVVCPPPDIIGYTVRQTVSVKVRDFKAIGDILSGVVGNGANSVSQLSFTVDDPTVVENEARAEALAKAKDKAKAMADAGGFRIGRLLNISEGGVIPYYGKRSYAMGGDEAAVSTVLAPTIEPGSQEFQVTMTLTYEIR